jgi:transcriptional regulator with XRE-family HTH domain
VTTSLAQKIRQARVDADLTREELAVALGVSLSTVVRYETGRTEPTYSKLARVARATKQPVAFFVGKAAA